MSRPWTCHWRGRVGSGIRVGLGGGEGFGRGDGRGDVGREGLYVRIEGRLHDWASVMCREGGRGGREMRRKGNWIYWLDVSLIVLDRILLTGRRCLVSAITPIVGKKRSIAITRRKARRGQRESGREKWSVLTYVSSSITDQQDCVK